MTPTQSREYLSQFITGEYNEEKTFTEQLRELFTIAEQQTYGIPLNREQVATYIEILMLKTPFRHYPVVEIDHSIEKDPNVTGPRTFLGYNLKSSICWEVGFYNRPGGEKKIVFHARSVASLEAYR